MRKCKVNKKAAKKAAFRRHQWAEKRKNKKFAVVPKSSEE
jgi:hypothetical protein